MKLFRSFYQTLSKLLLHGDNKAITYNEVVSAFLAVKVEHEMLSFFRPLASSTALTVIYDEFQTSDLDLQRTRFKRQRTSCYEHMRIQFQVQSSNKSNLKNLVFWRCDNNDHIKKYYGMIIRDTNFTQVANVAEHLHSEEDNVCVDSL